MINVKCTDGNYTKNLVIEMAKRANPFIEDFVPQSKVHVGIKQFNNNEDRLKKVYEKTLQLLFKGAKKSSAQDTVNVTGADISHKNRGKMKQLVIGKDGSLIHSDAKVVVEDKSVAALCGCGSPTVESSCAYCEKRLCSSCQRHCEQCQRPHCSLCSLAGSEGSEVCVSCYC